MTKDEAMKLALEALECIDLADNDKDFLNSHECYMLDAAITALREAPAEQPAQQEPSDLDAWKARALQAEAVVAKFMAPQPVQRTWVGLTTADRKEIERQSVYVEGAIRLTEAKLKEKNA